MLTTHTGGAHSGASSTTRSITAVTVVRNLPRFSMRATGAVLAAVMKGKFAPVAGRTGNHRSCSIGVGSAEARHTPARFQSGERLADRAAIAARLRRRSRRLRWRRRRNALHGQICAGRRPLSIARLPPEIASRPRTWELTERGGTAPKTTHGPGRTGGAPRSNSAAVTASLGRRSRRRPRFFPPRRCAPSRTGFGHEGEPAMPEEIDLTEVHV